MTEPSTPDTGPDAAGEAPVLSLPGAPAVHPGIAVASPSGYPAGDRGRLLAGLRRHWGTALTALLCAWSGIWLGVWLLAATAFLGAVVGLFGTALTGGGAPSVGGGLLAIVGGGIAGAAEAVAASLRSLLVEHPLELLGALAGGAVIAGLGTMAAARLEPSLLGLRGCRRLSRRESARIVPLMTAAARDLGLRDRPELLVSGSGSLRVRAHARHLVIGRALLEELGDAEDGDHLLAAVLAHGLAHWAAGDGAAAGLILACGLPLAAVYNAGCWMADQRNSLVGLAGWIVLWPAWVLVRLVLEPVSAFGSRRREYEADAAVRAAGRGAALHRALSFLGELEAGGSGWERALTAAHPPLELRLEALEGEGWPA
jgi:Zn-dependent protease with chaperone function